MIERDRHTNDSQSGSALRSSIERFKSSGTILAAAVLVAGVLLSMALINRYRLRQATQLIDQGQYQAARVQLDAMLPLFEGNRTAQYHRVMNMRYQQMALPMREAAEEARQRAEQANAPQLADELWLDALHTYEMGKAQAAENDWAAAAQSWEYAVDVFDQAYRRSEYANRFLAEIQQPLQ